MVADTGIVIISISAKLTSFRNLRLNFHIYPRLFAEQLYHVGGITSCGSRPPPIR